jgi:hypothetical protein
LVFLTKSLKMRFILILVFIATLFQFTNKANSQTLQFSQVLLVTTTQTVPPNKIWKIETVFPHASFSSSGGNGIIAQLVINNNAVNVSHQRPDAGMSFMPFPAWLPSGTTLAAGQFVHWISVIEFTVVP